MKKVMMFIFSILSLFFLISCQEEVLSYTIDEVINQIEITYTNEDQSDSVTQDIILPNESELMKYAQVIWSSSHLDIISKTGVVTRPLDDTVVTLTLSVSLKGEMRNRVFLITVKGTAVYHDLYVKIFDEVSSSRILEGQLFPELEPEEYDGYRFIGWFLDEDYSTPFDFNTPIVETTWIYAKYEAILLIDVIIHIYQEDIELLNYDLIDSIILQKEVGTLVSYQAFFAGFELNKELSTDEGVVENEPLVLELYFDRLIFSITYLIDGLVYDYDFFSFEEEIESIEDPQKQGYVFIGWSLEPNGELFDFDTTLTEDIELYAIFEFAQTYLGYYQSIQGVSDGQLLAKLRQLISQMRTLSYDSARDILQDSDEDPNNHLNVILVYDRRSVRSTWDGGTTWNREHVWPQSLLGSASASDIQNLKPSTPSVNSSRGNLPFTDGTGSYRTINGGFFPGDQDKGDIARIVLYMHVRWNINISLVGNLNTFLKWHKQDPVDLFERNRNEVLYDYQENRNPFIDHPEFAERIWGPITIHHEDDQTVSVLNLYRKDDIYFLDIKVYIPKKESYQI